MRGHPDLNRGQLLGSAVKCSTTELYHHHCTHQCKVTCPDLHLFGWVWDIMLATLLNEYEPQGSAERDCAPAIGQNREGAEGDLHFSDLP